MLASLGYQNMTIAPDIAQEIAEVGIIASDSLDEIGTIYTINAQPFTVIGRATFEEFIQAVECCGLDAERFRRDLASAPYFLRISTD